MAQVSFAPDATRPPLDAKLEEVGAQALLIGKPIRLRIQPDLYDPDKRGYYAWAGLTWMLDLDDVEEGRRLREVLTVVMAAFGDERQAKLLKLLGTL